MCTLLLAQLYGISCRQSSAPKHPMDPLDADEMRIAQTVLRANGLLSDGRRVTLLDVNEPPKAVVLNGRAVARAAFAVIYDATRNATGEAIVDVSAQRLRSWRVVPMVQPALDARDASLTDSIVRANDSWRAALGRRGIDPQSKVTVFAWSAGQLGGEDSAHHRLVRAVTYLRAARDNEMAATGGRSGRDSRSQRASGRTSTTKESFRCPMRRASATPGVLLRLRLRRSPR